MSAPVAVMPSKVGPPGPMQIPREMAERAWGAYCRQGCGRSGQTLDDFQRRGGFSWGELDEFIPGWREELSELARLTAALAAAAEREAALRKALEEATAAIEATEVSDEFDCAHYDEERFYCRCGVEEVRLAAKAQSMRDAFLSKHRLARGEGKGGA